MSTKKRLIDLNFKNYLRIVLVSLVTVFIFWFLLKDLDISKLGQVFCSSILWFLLLALLLTLVFPVLVAWRWKILVSVLGYDIKFIDSLYMDVANDPQPEKLEGTFFKNNPEKSFRRVIEMMDQDSVKKGWQESLEAFARWKNDVCIPSVSKVKAPITAINSDMEPTNVEGFIKYAPSFRVKIMKDVGHLVFWDDPNTFNQLLEESIIEFIQE